MKTMRRWVLCAVAIVMAVTCLAPVTGSIHATEATEQSVQDKPAAGEMTMAASTADPYANKTGWVVIDGRKYYYYKGMLLKGKRKIKRVWFDFDTTTGALKRAVGDDIDMRAQRYYSRKNYLIYVSYSAHRVRIYRGYMNNWVRIKNYPCTMGKRTRSMRTPTGEFTIKSRGKYFNTGGNQRCWYYTQFYGNYLFHSVLYKRSWRPKKITDGRLGINASHGCIRLNIDDARWIYNNIPRKTKVVIKEK